MLSISYELTTLLVLIEIKEVNHSCPSESHNVIAIHAYITLVLQTTTVIEIGKKEKELGTI